MRDAADIQVDQFRFNLQAQWGEGVDALRMLIKLSRDIGTEFHRRVGWDAIATSRRRGQLNKTLFHLNVRATQIASEVMVLMENSYADGEVAYAARDRRGEKEFRTISAMSFQARLHSLRRSATIK